VLLLRWCVCHQGKVLCDGLSLDSVAGQLAEQTPGFSGAMLEHVVNEAAIIAGKMQTHDKHPPAPC
jgi:ATP-dependent Zn protease